MITDIEKEQLDRIRDHEADFYAELLFLALYRRAYLGLLGKPEDQAKLVAENIATEILGVYADINQRTME